MLCCGSGLQQHCIVLAIQLHFPFSCFCVVSATQRLECIENTHWIFMDSSFALTVNDYMTYSDDH